MFFCGYFSAAATYEVPIVDLAAAAAAASLLGPYWDLPDGLSRAPGRYRS